MSSAPTSHTRLSRHLSWLAASALTLITGCLNPARPNGPVPTEPLHAETEPARLNLGAAQTSAETVGQQPWMLEEPATNREIEGYASAPSVNKGESIQLFVSTISPNYTLSVYRMGWYGGAGALLMDSRSSVPGMVQAPPVVDAATGLAECRWTNPVTITTGTAWQSGVYLVKLMALGGAGAWKSSYIMFVVRDDARASDFLFQTSINTSQAYNPWGGKSLYDHNSTDGRRASKVSLNRPYASIEPGSSAAASKGVGAGKFLGAATNDQLGGWEYNTIRFLEREGYDVTYTTDYDTHKRPTTLLGHKALLVVGHDEYWTMAQRVAIRTARDAGVGLGFIGSNVGYWQVRFEPSLTGTADRTMVGYKDAALDPVKGLNSSVMFRDVGLPEDRLLGVMWRGGWPVDNNFVVENASTWVTAGTGLVAGSVLPGLVGYEIDDMVTDTLITGIQRIGHSLWQGNLYSDMTVYTALSGATVFATGSMYWTFGLDDYYAASAPRAPRVSAAAQQMTRNVLNRFKNGGGVIPAVGTVTAVLGSATLSVGQTTTATVTLRDLVGTILTGRVVTWSSSNPTVATVSSTGVVTAVAPGSATITATSEGVSGSASLTVAAVVVPVASMSVTIASGTLLTTQTSQATATPRDAAGAALTGRTITWSSSNTGVATVSSSGLVTAVTPGTATITATSEGKSGSVGVTVSATVATVGVTITDNALITGETAQASATLKNAAGAAVTRPVVWSTSNAAVATVSSAGVVTGVGGGTATITATSEGKTGTVSVTVAASVATVGVAIDDDTRRTGQTAQATATVRDAGNNVLTGRTITWSSSNTAVATVSSSGLISGIGIGTATITATAEGRSGSAGITISAMVSTVSVAIADASLLPGQTAQATATLKDAAGAAVTRPVVWSTSNAARATVSSAGVVTGVSGGAVTITATSEGKTGSVSITVAANVATVGVTIADATLRTQQAAQATATLRDAGSTVLTDRTTAWSSSNSAVATVSSSGLVTGVGIGTATITATSEGKSGTVGVTVSATVATVAVAIADATLQTGQTAAATATLRDAGGVTVTRPVSWSSSNAAVATVSSAGVVTGVGGGSATITATSEGKTGSVGVSVSATPPLVATFDISCYRSYCAFDGRESVGAASFKWEFGDGDVSTDADGWIWHQYDRSATFTVKLIITGTTGATRSLSKTVRCASGTCS